ncbi:acyltransferase [Nonomuraea mesophila]|uniref:Acyltransferase n=1 Tax=Nonomuraea mesophila TaxID=2530382 RepID=A0A4R5FEM1_9ACTN|nr:acyltransferase [Nonomuraea mesophila]TDE48509.1 acyltransferase [Nonomuraea mesophila]
MTQPVDQQAAPPATAPRLFHVDNLRTALMALVVVHHSVIAYSNIPAWYYIEPRPDSSGTLVDLLLLFNQTFFMGAFFLISGLFVPRSYDRKGAGPFLRERLVRLGVPLLLWLLLIRPLVTTGRYTTAVEEAARQGDDLPYWKYYVSAYTPGPLWFVEVLLVFSALYVLWRLWTGRRGRTPENATAAGRAPGVAAIAGFVVGLALVTYVWRMVVPMGVTVLGLPSAGYLPQYAALFVVGLVAARRGWLQNLPRAAGRAGFATAAVATLAVVFVVGVFGETSLGHGSLSSLLMAASESALAVGIILGLLVLFRQRFGRQGRLRRFLSAHAFTVYVIHPPVLVALGYALSGVEAPAIAKAALLTAIGLPLCWATAYVVRALPGAKKVL